MPAAAMTGKARTGPQTNQESRSFRHPDRKARSSSLEVEAFSTELSYVFLPLVISVLSLLSVVNLCILSCILRLRMVVRPMAIHF
jgi:hypothetical protein